jgi:predicted aspartyl protease
LIIGTVSEDSVPTVMLDIGGRHWPAIIDTGFNGDLELPLELKSVLPCRYIGEVVSLLAGGQRIEEDAFHVDIPFDGQINRAEATFVGGDTILVGTRLLHAHRLEIDFPARTVVLRRGES